MASRNAKSSRRKRTLKRRVRAASRYIKRAWRTYRHARPLMKVLVAALALLISWLAINWLYQVVHKPSELFFPVSGTLNKTPAETWARYAPIFEKYATPVMTPQLLAAIAQVEGSGNPVARTYWRWSWTLHPLELYRPASSAVGMYQITDGNFAEARRYCIRQHAVVENGPWLDWQSCWFNGLYTRTIPAHAVELTSAYLDHSVAAILARHRVATARLQQKQELAALIHLCGAGAGDDFVKRAFRFISGQRCGDHAARMYVDRVQAMQAVFERLERERGD